MNHEFRPLIMGILNVTPDSFADGGRHNSLGAALERGRQMLREGADIIDVGGESTRPGAIRVDADEQIRRTIPVIEALASEMPDATISIDTTRVAVARRAIAAGARIINDISAAYDEPGILRLAAAAGVRILLVHGRGDFRALEQDPQSADPTAAVEAFLRARVIAAVAAGVAESDLILDPGIGFGKTRQQNLGLLKELARLVAIGLPLALGASRKRFMGAICANREPDQLIPATCACTALGVMAGVSVFRVHDVAANRQVADVVAAIRASRL